MEGFAARAVLPDSDGGGNGGGDAETVGSLRSLLRRAAGVARQSDTTTTVPYSPYTRRIIYTSKSANLCAYCIG